MREIKALILDMDGVLWRGPQPLGDLGRLFAEVERLGLRYVFVTNNATRSVAQYAARLRGLGVPADEKHILNAAQAAVHLLQEALPQGAAVYVVGEAALQATLAAAGFRIANKGAGEEASEEARAEKGRLPDAQAVVVALSRACTYDQLRTATLLVRRGALFVGTNPDRTFPAPEGLVPGAGALIAALEAATDQPARIAGKPQPLLFRLALQRLGARPEETLVVGDRLETDIAGGQAAGCRTALVLSGVTSMEQAMAWEPAPDLIAMDFAAVLRFLARERAWQGRRVVAAADDEALRPSPFPPGEGDGRY